MKTGHMILSAASIIPLLSGCASFQNTADNEAWGIKPAFNVRHSSETPESYYQLGRYYQGQNRYEQAQIAYQKALAIDGLFAEARNGLGVIYAMQGRQPESLEQFRLAVKLAPKAAHIHNNLGYALYLGMEYAKAASALESAVTLDPANQSARTNLALALEKTGDKVAAKQIMMAQAVQSKSAEKVSPPLHEAPQAQPGTPSLTPAPGVATMPATSPAPHQTLALPKDWGVITKPTSQPVPRVESSTQAVLTAPNVYELRERAEVQVQVAPTTTPQQQAFAPQKVRESITARSAQRPLPTVETHAQVAQSMARVTELPARTSAPLAKPYRIEVSNGNGVTGMAKKVAGYLGGEGYSGARLTNQRPFQVASSQVQYRTGYQKQAQALALSLPGSPDIAQANDLRGDISVKVLLGKDVAGNVAYFERSQDKIRLVRHGSDS